MRLQNYIIEGRGTDLSMDEAKEYLKKNCKQALYGYTRGHILYRGVPRVVNNYLKAEPKGGRISANTDNYYTLMMDNFKQWKGYPKRSRSFICSSSFSSANNYGTLYAVFPFDNTTVAVAPTRDIWLSFRNSFSGMTLADLNEVLTKMFKKAGLKLSQTSYSDIIKSFNKFDEIAKKDPMSFLNFVTQDVAFNDVKWLHYWYEKKGSFQQMMGFLLDPKLNNFTTVKVGGDYGMENECWFDAKCIMVRKEVVPTRPNPVGDILTSLGYNV